MKNIRKIQSRKRIALVAHDHKKKDLIEWAVYNKAALARHELVASSPYLVPGPVGMQLLSDLRGMGETAAFANRSAPPLTRGILMRAMEIYAQRFSDPDGRVRATFELITLSGWAPGPDQPKAKRPGSATARLADALGVKEQQAGEKAGGKT